MAQVVELSSGRGCFRHSFSTQGISRSSDLPFFTTYNPLTMQHRRTQQKRSVLPDGFFSDQKSQLGYILDEFGMENVVIYSVHLEFFTTTGEIFWHLVILKSFGNFEVIWYIFSLLWYIVPRKIWQPWRRSKLLLTAAGAIRRFPLPVAIKSIG
jgi:hypothetical protein